MTAVIIAEFEIPAEWHIRTPLILAAISVGLSGLGWATRKGNNRESGASSKLLFISLLCSVAAVVIAAVPIFTLAASRIFDPYNDPSLHKWPLAVVCGLAALSGLIGERASKSKRLPAAILAVLALLTIAASALYGAPSESLASFEPASDRASDRLQWTLLLQVGLAGLLAIAATLQDAVYRRRRWTAWPDRLHMLTEAYAPWTAYAQVEAILAAIILILGVYHLILAGTQTTFPILVNTTSAIIAGTICLFMSYRRWSGNTALLGMTLVSLGIVGFGALINNAFFVDANLDSYGARMPVILNGFLFSLWITIALWLWLSGFWKQQLLDGRAWTTAGKMIPYAESTGVYLLVIAVICAFQMTIWPLRPLMPPRDDSMARIIFGMAGISLLSLQACRAALMRESVVFAGIGCALIIAAITFLVLRWPQPSLRGTISQYSPALLAGICIPLLVLAEALDRKSVAKSFATPIWFLSLLFLPAIAISQLMSTTRLAESWIRGSTLLLLAVTFFIAGFREHRRSFLVLAVVLLAVAFT